MKTTRRYRKAYNKGKADGYAEGYKQGLHDGNPFIKIVEAASDMVKVISDKMSDPEFLEMLKKAKAIENQDREYFNGICPYTDNPCDDWNCLECEVEHREREWMEGEEE